MSPLELRLFYDRYLAALNGRDFDAMPGFIHDEVTLNGQPVSRREIVEVQHRDVEAVPDLHWHLKHLIVEGERLGALLVNTGTPSQTFLGVAPNGAAFEIAQYAIYQVVDGRFKHMSVIRDAEAVARQLAQ